MPLRCAALRGWATVCSCAAVVRAFRTTARGVLHSQETGHLWCLGSLCLRLWAASVEAEAAIQDSALKALHVRREQVLLVWERGHDAALRMCQALIREQATSLKRLCFSRWVAAWRAAQLLPAGVDSPTRSSADSVSATSPGLCNSPASSAPTCVGVSPATKAVVGQVVEAWHRGEAAAHQRALLRSWAAASALLADRRAFAALRARFARRLWASRLLRGWAGFASQAAQSRRLRCVGATIEKRLHAGCVALRTRCELACALSQARQLRAIAFSSLVAHAQAEHQRRRRSLASWERLIAAAALVRTACLRLATAAASKDAGGRKHGASDHIRMGPGPVAGAAGA
mmetsp:Transcript_140614/g.448327  ORF Transcript_140614/g.448327 Transcript_140614/m.448327 type:complete len:344 (+) Transcript_140614:3728-4759(+)